MFGTLEGPSDARTKLTACFISLLAPGAEAADGEGLA